jgi:hypothetical protein
VDIAKILTSKFPGTLWCLNGDNYSGLEWLDDSPKPSEVELKKLWPGVQHEAECVVAEKQRQAAYAAEADPLFFKYQRGEATEQEWLDAVQAVKDAHPYPVKEGK